MFVYTIQLVVKPFDNRLYRVYSRLSNRLYNPVWQLVERTVAVRSTRLSNRLSNPFDNRLDVCLHDTAGCQAVKPVVSYKRGLGVAVTVACTKLVTVSWMDQRNELPCFFQVSVTCSGIQCVQHHAKADFRLLIFIFYCHSSEGATIAPHHRIATQAASTRHNFVPNKRCVYPFSR